MSGPLFKATLKANWVIALAITLFIMIYVATSLSMFNPESAEFIESMLNVMPEGMIKVFGFENLGTDLTQYISNYLYGFILLVFPFIYTSVVGNRLMAKHVDSGSMSYLLATPNTRNKVALTQAVYHIGSTASIFAFITGAAILMSVSMWPGMLKIGVFLVLNLVTFSATLVVAGISFLASCLFSDTRFSLAFGVGIPLFFVVCRMIHGLGEKIEWLKYLSVYTVIDIERILSGGSYALFSTIILLAVSAVIYAAGILIFNKKSLVI
jgi:ABC-2 type transport system permease protein